MNIQNKCRFISEGILPGSKNDYGLWNTEKVSNYYGYAPLNQQEKIQTLLFNNNFLHTGELENFKKVFPKSPYISRLEVIVKKNEAKSNEPYTLGYNINKTFTIKNVKEYNDFEKFIKDNFKDKPVFVDFWASYCGPCLQEFSFASNLFTFLKGENIEIVYVSIDNSKDINKWSPDIKKYNLEGHHYFATNEIQSSLRKFLDEKDGIYIPRYLLFDSKGKLVLKNAKRPSEGKALYDEILKALQ